MRVIKPVNTLNFKTFHILYIYNTVGCRFATVRFTTIHFYDPYRVGPSTPDWWCITAATQASFLYSVHYFVRCACVSSFYILVQFF